MGNGALMANDDLVNMCTQLTLRRGMWLHLRSNAFLHSSSASSSMLLQWLWYLLVLPIVVNSTIVSEYEQLACPFHHLGSALTPFNLASVCTTSLNSPIDDHL